MKDRSTEFDLDRIEAMITPEEREAERWASVPGYKGIYEVSDMGRVRSYWSRQGSGLIDKPRVLTVRISSNGYCKVRLYRRGVKTTEHWVHRLVMMAFEPQMVLGFSNVHHRDRKKTNNRLSNLEWLTQSENTRHAELTARQRLEEATA